MTSKENHKYANINPGYNSDIDHDSDTTLNSPSLLPPKRMKRYSRTKKFRVISAWLRWGSVLFLQSIILLMLFLRYDDDKKGWDRSKTEVGGDINGIYIPTSHKYTQLKREELKFIPNMTSNVNRIEVQTNWDKLLPLGSGNIKIPGYEQYPMLSPPFRYENDQFFDIAWPHALHCLYYILDAYHQLVVQVTDGNTSKQRSDGHFGHCVEYIRTQVMCMADMSIEGAWSITAEGSESHMCRNIEEARSWIEARRADDVQSIVSDGHRLNLTEFCLTGFTQKGAC